MLGERMLRGLILEFEGEEVEGREENEGIYYKYLRVFFFFLGVKFRELVY